MSLWLTHSPPSTFTHSPPSTFTHSPPRTFTHSPPSTFTHSPPSTFTHSPPSTFTHSPPSTFTHSPPRTFTHQSTHFSYRLYYWPGRWQGHPQWWQHRHVRRWWAECRTSPLRRQSLQDSRPVPTCSLEAADLHPGWRTATATALRHVFASNYLTSTQPWELQQH